MSYTETLTSEVVNRTIDGWEVAARHVANLLRQLEDAQKNLDRIKNNLGEILAPAGAVPGDRFHIWIRRNEKQEALLEVFVHSIKQGETKPTEFTVKWWKPE